MITLRTTPLMYDDEVRAIERLLKDLAPKRVLEWGSGGSTLYFPKIFGDIEWVSVEHSTEYAKKVKSKATSNVTLHHLTPPEYYVAPLKMGKFDVIFVDGIRRTECLSRARHILADGGTVVLHDAGRIRYTPAYKLYEESEVLVPCKGGNENLTRGLTMFRKPIFKVDERVEVVKGSSGVIYISWGMPAALEVEASIRSLQSIDPNIKVKIVGDDIASEKFFGQPGIDVSYCAIDPFRGQSTQSFLAGMVKPLLGKYSPFERTLYVDADTAFKRHPDNIFKLLDKWDFVIAEAETRDLTIPFPDRVSETRETAKMLGTPHILYHNSGMFGWRKNKLTAGLFETWYNEWCKFSGWDEQIALLRALMLSPNLLFLNLPYTWNCRQEKDTYFVYHKFATMSARKFPRHIVIQQSPRFERVMQRTLVSVTVAPGVIVKCHPGDEEKVIEMMRQQMGGRNVRARG